MAGVIGAVLLLGPGHESRAADPCTISWDGGAFNYGVDYPNTVDDFGQANQFDQNASDCPDDGVFTGGTYCDTILK